MTESWLQDPSGSWTMHFYRDPASWTKYPWYYIDRGRYRSGKDLLLKSRKYMARFDAVQLWKDLRKDGWKKVEAQW